jgi:prepilin-type N-terminal cleavage/methylation domain-containing protein
MRSPQPAPTRRAFTLIEMLVVLTLILLLAAIAVAFVPRMAERQKTGRAADQLMGWLVTARQWAARDSIPTGVRIQPNPTTSYGSQLQYIQQPQPFYAGQNSYVYTQTAANNQVGVHFANNTPINFYDGLGAGIDPTMWLVQPGTDYLEMGKGGPVYEITSIVNNGNGLMLSRALPNSVSQQTDYQIFRSPRVLAGETTLSLPQDTAIDLTMNKTYGNSAWLQTSGTGNIDILFSPGGGLIGIGPLSDKVALWVRDVTQDPTTPGDQTIVVVYVRTGFVAAHPVDTSVNASLQGIVNPGSTVIQVANPAGISTGSYLVLDPGPNSETVVVVPPGPAGNSVPISPTAAGHAAGVRVVSDPYGFARDGRTSGM